jgi:tetratricopeptide (TPR) repeat protein
MRVTTSPITQIHILFMVLILTASANAAVRRFPGQTPQPDADTRAKAAYEHGRKLADGQQFDAAIENFRTAIRLKPDDMLAREWLGLAYIFSKRYEEAIQTYNKLLELKPDYANAYGNLGYVYFQRGPEAQ